MKGTFHVVLKYAPKFSPQDGGDTLIECQDDVCFLVHSTLLQHSFPCLLGNSPPSAVYPIKFPYSSDVLLLILNFISSCPFKPAGNKYTRGFVVDCFEAANNFKLASLVSWLRSQLVAPKTRLYRALGPIGAYGICHEYSFKPEKQQAFRSCIGQLKFDDKDVINTVTTQCPNNKGAFELVCRLARRNTIINKLLSSFYMNPLDMRSNYCVSGLGYDAYEELTCSACQNATVFGPPSWMSFWAYCAKNELLKTPREECDHIFKVQYLGRRVTALELAGYVEDDIESYYDRKPMCQVCLKTILFEKSSLWEEWADSIKSVLKDDLGGDF